MSTPLYGVRAWSVLWDGRLVSPHQGKLWDGDSLSSSHWSDAAAIRGECGVHARAIPAHWDGQWWEGAETEGPSRPPVWGVVLATGREAAVGPLGWRAQGAQIALLVCADPGLVKLVARAYPHVTVVLQGEHLPALRALLDGARK